jgi:hypothetical protein
MPGFAESGNDIEHLVRGGEVEDEKILVGRCAAGTSVVVGSELEVIPVARQAHHHDLVAVRGGPKKLGQAQVPAIEVENLGELVGGTGDSDLYRGKAIGPASSDSSMLATVKPQAPFMSIHAATHALT